MYLFNISTYTHTHKYLFSTLLINRINRGKIPIRCAFRFSPGRRGCSFALRLAPTATGHRSLKESYGGTGNHRKPPTNMMNFDFKWPYWVKLLGSKFMKDDNELGMGVGDEGRCLRRANLRWLWGSGGWTNILFHQLPGSLGVLLGWAVSGSQRMGGS